MRRLEGTGIRGDSGRDATDGDLGPMHVGPAGDYTLLLDRGGDGGGKEGGGQIEVSWTRDVTDMVGAGDDTVRLSLGLHRATWNRVLA